MLSLGNVPAYRQTISPAEDPAIELRRIKKAWLWPERGGRKVTIAIGLLTDETVVLAADREETVGNQKVDVSKFIRRYHKETAMVIAGAGPDCHIETMAELLSNEIKQSKDRSYESLKSAFRERLLIYYRDHVLCWPTAQEREDNDFNLLIALMRDRE